MYFTDQNEKNGPSRTKYTYPYKIKATTPNWLEFGRDLANRIWNKFKY